MPGPFLDVSEVLLDPEIAGPFVVYRRTAIVNDHGRVESNRQQLPAIGVITAAHGNDLRRLEDSDSMGRVISIITRTMLQGPSGGAGQPEMMPDMVGWGGGMFVVKSVDPYPQYGRGFIQALAASMENLDPPPSVMQRAAPVIDAADEQLPDEGAGEPDA
jgi:hypothetical protein